MSVPRAAIFGCAGPDLGPDERAFFRDADPLGFILFGRNVDTPERTRRLVEELRSSVARAEAPVLIDQEGGRVARLRPPHWRKAPPAVRRRLVLLLTQHRDVQALSCETRLSTTRVRAALHELWMSGLISGNDGDGYRVTAAGRYAYFIRAPENDAITAHAVRKCPA